MVAGQLRVEVLCSVPTKRMTTPNYFHRYVVLKTCLPIFK